jgi:hypothetical protein
MRYRLLAGCDTGGGGDDDDSKKITNPAPNPDPNKVAKPTAVSAEGTRHFSKTITLSTTTEGATIYYTTNGNTPDKHGIMYSAAISITGPTTLKAIAVKDGMTDSDVLTAEYTIDMLPSGDTVSDVTNQNITSKLAGLSAEQLHTLVFTSGVTIKTEDTNADGVWATINKRVTEAQKYVILDLSACTVYNYTITGEISSLQPTRNHMNIIKYNPYIKGIILPNNLGACSTLNKKHTNSIYFQ